MSRVADWQGRFFEELDAARDRPFSWDGWTCFDFAMQVYVAITGQSDPREQYPPHRTEREAVVILGRAGGAGAILASLFGEPIGPAFAQRGDIVLAEFGSGPQPGVCAGFWSFAPGEQGLLPLRTLSALSAWRI